MARWPGTAISTFSLTAHAGWLRERRRAWCGYLAEILPVARALEAAYITGDGYPARSG
jgi:hypothetical protein